MTILYITVMFWTHEPIQLEYTLDKQVCSTELVKEQTKSLKQWKGMKMIITECKYESEEE